MIIPGIKDMDYVNFVLQKRIIRKFTNMQEAAK